MGKDITGQPPDVDDFQEEGDAGEYAQCPFNEDGLLKDRRYIAYDYSQK